MAKKTTSPPQSLSLTMHAKSDPSQNKCHSNPRLCSYHNSQDTGHHKKKGKREKYDYKVNKPLLMTFRSANHSPKTVNKNASEFTMGTVRDSSTLQLVNK